MAFFVVINTEIFMSVNVKPLLQCPKEFPV